MSGAGGRRAFAGKPMTFHESLHLCGCDTCRVEIAERLKSEPALKPDFADYLRTTYPATAYLIEEPQP